MINLVPREIRALAVIAELCERDRAWLADVFPDPTDQLAVTSAVAKLYGEEGAPKPLARMLGNRGPRHRMYASLRNSSRPR